MMGPTGGDPPRVHGTQHGTAGAGTEFGFSMGFNFGAPQAALLNNRQGAYVVKGQITYDDMFGAHHAEPFCRIVVKGGPELPLRYVACSSRYCPSAGY